ncbi:MAG: VOC family protein [Streptosporangiaceae bacterium]|jgi:catechol 2,3-dioxygenase-like lactoylglutathione lyase family enzyme
MPTRLVQLVIDATDPARLGRFWAAALGWEVVTEEPDEVEIWPRGYRYPDPMALPLTFLRVPEDKDGKNRVHLDLATETAAHQAAEMERLLSLGAVPADIGQENVPWQVLADPEGNEFCVLEPQPLYPQTGLFGGLVVDCSDPARMAGFWELATGWTRRGAGANGVSLRSPQDVGPYLTLLKVPEAKTSKNRVHLDVAPQPGEDHAAAVKALLEAGAAPADVGQGDVPWAVLADPEGGEFCVLTPR